MKDLNKALTRLFFIAAVLIVAWLVFLEPAEADDVTLTWTNPTGTEECTAGPPLTNHAGTRIWQLVTEINDPNVETYTIPAMPPGTYEYVGTAFDENGVGSRISGTTTKTVETFIAPAGSAVYQPVSINSGFWFIPMGTVTVDTDCDASQRANDYYRVPTDQVTWNDGVDARPVFVVAACE